MMPGSSIKLGYTSWNLHRLVSCGNGEQFEITLNMTVRGF